MKLSSDIATKRFTDKFSTSARMDEEAKKYIPGGGSRSIVRVGPHSIFVESGEGAYLQTVDGHRLCDFHNNFSANVLGHNHPAINKAIEEVCSSGFSFGNPTKCEARLAKILCNRIESVDLVVFMMSGTEACMASITLARAYTGKGKVAKLEGGYHGTSNDFWWSIHPDAPEFIHCGLQKAFGVKPDLTVMAKSIGGGLPIGAVGGKDEIMKLNESGQVFHSGTHHGHALSCAAGAACMENYTQPLIDKMNQQAQKIKNELKLFVDEKAYPVNLTGLGSAIGFEMLDEHGREIRSCRDIMTYCDEEAVATFNFELINRGYLPMWSRGANCTMYAAFRQ